MTNNIGLRVNYHQNSTNSTTKTELTELAKEGGESEEKPSQAASKRSDLKCKNREFTRDDENGRKVTGGRSDSNGGVVEINRRDTAGTGKVSGRVRRKR